MVKQRAEKAKPEINDTEKENVEKKNEKSIEIDNQQNHGDRLRIEDNSEIDERNVGFKKDKVNLKDKFGNERENSNKIEGKNQLPTINKECKGDVKERNCNSLDKRDEIQSKDQETLIWTIS